MRLLVDPVEPGDGHVLQYDHDEQRQRGRVVVEHGDEVVPRALHKQEADGERQQAAAHCGTGRGWLVTAPDGRASLTPRQVVLRHLSADSPLD